MLNVRQLTQQDFPQFLALGQIMQQECEPDVEYDEHTMLLNMFQCINDPTRSVLNGFLCFSNSRLIGMAVGAIMPFYFSPKLTAILQYWYVLPRYRVTRAADELLRAFERWARQRNVIRLYVGAERVNDVEFADKVNRMIEHRGFKRFGHQFYKEVGDGVIQRQ